MALNALEKDLFFTLDHPTKEVKAEANISEQMYHRIYTHWKLENLQVKSTFDAALDTLTIQFGKNWTLQAQNNEQKLCFSGNIQQFRSGLLSLWIGLDDDTPYISTARSDIQDDSDDLVTDKHGNCGFMTEDVRFTTPKLPHFGIGVYC